VKFFSVRTAHGYTLDIEEMFRALGPVTVKRMFGGKGVYHKGAIIAVEVREEMLLKADEISAPEFAKAGARQWAYEGKGGKAINMPYWSVPEEAYDDPDVMARFTRFAYDAALRAAAGKKAGKMSVKARK